MGGSLVFGNEGAISDACKFQKNNWKSSIYCLTNTRAEASVFIVQTSF